MHEGNGKATIVIQKDTKKKLSLYGVYYGNERTFHDQNNQLSAKRSGHTTVEKRKRIAETHVDGGI